jgi:hypothetical protein
VAACFTLAVANFWFLSGLLWDRTIAAFLHKRKSRVFSVIRSRLCLAPFDHIRRIGSAAPIWVPISNRFPAARQHQSNFALFPFIEFRPALGELAFECAQIGGIRLLKLLLESVKQL